MRPLYRKTLDLIGSATWTRTRDPVINSHLLYQLSYRGINWYGLKPKLAGVW